MVLLLLITVATTAIFLLLLWRYSYWYRRGVPQGNPLKLFGDLNDIFITWTPHFDQYVELSRKFTGKPFYGIYNITKPCLVVRDPEMIREVLTKKFSSFSDNGFELDMETEPIMGRDPFFQTGERWKESRANFTSLMTPARLKSMLLQMREVSKEAVNYLKDMKHESGKGNGADVKDFSVRFLTNLLIRATLSVEAGSFEEQKNDFIEAGLHVIDDGFSGVLTTALLMLAPKLGTYFGSEVVPKKTKTFFDNVVKSQKEYRAKNGISRDDVLDSMIKKTKSIKNGTGGKNRKDDPDLDVLAMVMLFFIEGFETTSTTASGALLELARNVELQEKLRSEILKACPPGKEINEEDLNSIPLLQHCFLESLRMYPPGLLSQRIATNDVVLQAKTGEEIFLKKGSCVSIFFGGYHRDPEFYPDPDIYNPERFDDEIQKRNFLGFGDGPRQCPGQKFAVLAGKILLASIVREFKLELSPKTSYPLKSSGNSSFLFILRGVWVRFIPL